MITVWWRKFLTLDAICLLTGLLRVRHVRAQSPMRSSIRVSRGSCIVLLGWMLSMSSEVFAYLDPGTGAMLVQIILGGVAGLAIAGKLFWARILAFLRRLNPFAKDKKVVAEALEQPQPEPAAKDEVR